jgi:cyclopropane fatty-acyl-phospholipid synthase-like methyltransferase
VSDKTRMTERVAERFRWAIEVMDPAPSDRLLEIGCGQGVAVSLIASLLFSGSILAIDRSRAMIDRAARRNREHVQSGRASVQAVALGDADLPGNRFDRVFAINVRLFQSGARNEAELLRRALKPDGSVYLFQQHPSQARTEAVTEELRTALIAHGFVVRDVLSKGSGATTMTCIVAGQQPRPSRRR